MPETAGAQKIWLTHGFLLRAAGGSLAPGRLEIGKLKMENENSRREIGRLALAAAAEKRGVGVIELTGNAGGTGGYEFYFVDEGAAPGLVDADAEFALHAFDLGGPGRADGGDIEGAAFTADRARVLRERRAYDRGPRGCEPRERGFSALEAAQGASQKFSGSFHGI